MKEEDMSFKEFEAMALKTVEERFGDKVFVGLRHERNEDDDEDIIRLHGLMITDTLLGLTQLIYMDAFYEACPNREYVGATIDKIIESYEYNLKALKEMMKESLEWYRNFENVKDHIYYRLMLGIEGGGLLHSVIYERYMDMNKLYYVYDKNQKMFKDGYIVLHTTHLNMWNVTAEEIKEIAEENMQKQPIEIRNLMDILDKELTEEEKKRLKEKLDDTDPYPYEMYVMKNTELEHGASAMCNKKAIRDFAEEHGADVVIIPSSVYEVILVVDIWNEEEFDYMALQLEDMLNEKNGEKVTPEDILSESIYLYRRSTDAIEMV